MEITVEMCDEKEHDWFYDETVKRKRTSYDQRRVCKKCFRVECLFSEEDEDTGEIEKYWLFAGRSKKLQKYPSKNSAA